MLGFSFLKNIEVVQECDKSRQPILLLTGGSIGWRCGRGGGLSAKHAGNGFADAATLVITALERIVGTGGRGLHGRGGREGRVG